MLLRPRSRWASAAFALAISTLPRASWGKPGDRAQETSSAAQPVEIARLRYRQGVEAYQAKRYREAIDYFLEADRLAPNAALSFNIARVYENTGDAAAALRWYRDYLRRDPAAADRAEVEKVIHSFETKLAEKGVQQITVLSDPSGAQVAIDARAVGVTPWTGEIAPGTHRLRIHRAGHVRVERDFEMTADRAVEVSVTLEVALEEAPAEPEKAPAPAAAAAPPAEPARVGNATFTTLGWIGIGAGGAALGGALVFEILRRGAESDAESTRTQIGYADHLDTMESRQTASRVLLGAGVVLAAAGGTLLWLGREKESPKVGLACAPGACVGAVRGAF